MLGQEAHSGGIHAAGIFQSCAATAIGGVCTFALTYCWQRYLGGEPPDWAKGAVPSLSGGLVVLGLWQGGRAFLRRHRRRNRRAPNPKGDRLSIYVADLQGDNAAQSARTSVVDSILKEIGSY